MKNVFRPALRTITWATLIGVIASGGAACTGSIASDPARDPEASVGPPRGGAPAAQPKDPVAGGGEPITPGKTGGGGPSQGGGCKSTGAVVGASRMRRLTNAEFVNTARALLGTPEGRVFAFDLPGESAVNGFENAAGLQTITEQHVTAYANVAEALVSDAFANAERRSRLVGCAPTVADRETCLRTFVERFGRRAWRRPLPQSEIDALMGWAKSLPADDDPWRPLAGVAQALLAHPKFLLLIEQGESVEGDTNAVRLDSYSVAARLAFFIWGSGPDDRLLDEARNGALDGEMTPTLDWMLGDSRARAGQRLFVHRWLRLKEVEQAQRETEQHPDWNEELRASMIEETLRLAEDVAWRKGADFRDLFTGGVTYVDARLAKLYGLATAPSGDWQKVTLPTSTQRHGLLTQAAFLTASGRIEKAHAILRGKMIQNALFCTNIEAPPNIPALEETTVPPQTSDRKHIELHVQRSGCVECHTLLNPVGYGLDIFDGVGKLRKVDTAGQPIDTSGTIPALGAYSGPGELSARIRESPQVTSCLSRQMYRFAAGRTDDTDDQCAIETIDKAFRDSGHQYGALVRALVRSSAFRTRVIMQPNGGQP